MFDSPLDWCTRCRDWVALDEPFAECARRHGCAREACPLLHRLRRAEELPRRPPWREADR